MLSRFMIGILLAFSLTGLVSAQEDTDTGSTEETTSETEENETTSGGIRGAIKDNIETNVPFEDAQVAVLKGIDTVVSKLNMAEENVKSLAQSNANPETIAIVVEALDKVETGLADYKIKVEATTSYDELEAVNTEMKATLKENSATIKASFEEAALAIAENAADTFVEFQDQMAEYLEALKVVCPEQEEEITAIETELAGMDEEITSLQTSLTAQDVDAAKASLKELSQSAQSIAADVETLSSTCQL